MTDRFFIDCESFSDVPIKNGFMNYVEGAEVMLVSYALNDDDVGLWDITRGEPMPAYLEDHVYDERIKLVAHQSAFDRRMFQFTELFPGADLSVARWEDTMVQALAHGLPGGLDSLCKIFGVDADKAKDKRGKQLIQLFCKPTAKGTRNTEATHPVQWGEFRGYAKSDISAMRVIHRKLPRRNYPDRPVDFRVWEIDQIINQRGFMIDRNLALAAKEAAAIEKESLKSRVQEATDGVVQAGTQGDQLLKYIVESYSVELPDMRADTLKRRIEDENLPLELRQLLDLRVQSNRNSSSKYTAALKAVNEDDRLRDTLQFSGAAGTGRWGGRVFQPQNMMRPTMDKADIDTAIRLIKDDPAFAVSIYDNLPEVLGNCVRGLIIAPPGKKLIVNDYSSIEGRGLAYLAREQYIVDFYRSVDAEEVDYDSYMLAYAICFGVDPASVNKANRQLGKPIELACFGAHTQVLTSNGIKRIVDVKLEDKVWDGQQWVKHQGVIDRGVKPVVNVDGIEVTPDHLINTQGTWKQAQELASSEPSLFLALATGLESLRSLALSSVAQVGCLWSWSDAAAVQSRMWSMTTIFARERARDAMPAQRKQQAIGEKTTGNMPVSCLTTNTGPDCSTVSPPASIAAPIQSPGSGQPTVAEASLSATNGEPTVASSLPIWSRLKAGITRLLNWIAPTTTRATNPVTFVSSPRKPTTPTDAPSSNCNAESTNLKRVYDIAHAGPRNQFTILSDSGALVVHNCGYGGGVAAFLTFAMTYHIDLVKAMNAIWETGDQKHLAECLQKYEWAKKHGYHAGLEPRMYAAFEYVKQKWRAARPKTVQFWDDLSDGFKSAIAFEKEVFRAGPICFKREGHWLYMRLPSGRCLTFLKPMMKGDQITFMGLDRYSKQWKRQNTHGGKLSGLATQAMANDILRVALPKLEDAGYETVLTVHDEAIAETPDDPAYSSDHMASIMTEEIEWLPGFPLASDGFETARYRKD